MEVTQVGRLYLLPLPSFLLSNVIGVNTLHTCGIMPLPRQLLSSQGAWYAPRSHVLNGQQEARTSSLLAPKRIAASKNGCRERQRSCPDILLGSSRASKRRHVLVVWQMLYMVVKYVIWKVGIEADVLC